MADIISAGPFATEGERYVAKVLQQLPSDWIVICNKMLPTGNRSYEIDFIVIGRRWVFLLDEKSWSGKIQGTDQLWVRSDGFSTRSPLAKADYISKILASHIAWRVTPLKEAGYFVHGGVILSVAEQSPQIHDARANNGIFLLGNVLERLQALDSQEGSPLVGSFSNHIKNALYNLSPRPQVPAKIDFWDIEDATTLRPGVRLFNAKMSSNPEQRRQLMVYDLGSEPLAQQEMRDFYMREFLALQQLYTIGHVPQVETPRIWSDDFLILPIVPPTGRSLYVYPQPETREEFVQELALAASSFKALGQFHAQNVLHRAIGPNTLYVQDGSSPKVIFTNFYAARIGTVSIAMKLDTLSIEDPYASIDLAIGYEHATPQTDCFSLALVFLERLSGTSLTDIRATVESEITFPAQPRWSAFLTPELANELTALFKQILTPLKDATPPVASEIAKKLNDLARRVTVTNQSVEGSVLDKRYKVHRLLGTGAMASTYLASDMDFESLGLFALKHYTSPSEVLQQAEAEFKTMRDLSSPYFPHIFAINPPQYEVHVQMEYIPGPTLQQVEKEFPWSLERWWTFAQHLLNAVEILEQKQLLHRDIKPANIILHESDNRPVLIDFGFAIRNGIAGEAAGTPLYVPPEAMTMDPPPSTDRYSLGVVLFKALLGYLPFTIDKLGKRVSVSLEQITDEKIRKIAHVLLHVVANNPDERPRSLEQLRQALQTAFVAVEEPEVAPKLQNKVNPWVKNVRSLYRNSDVGNQNNRGLDTPFVKETYVPTALDKKLLPAIFEQRPKVVFLSGNPGDGKTAFLEQIQQELQRRQAVQKQERSDPSGWEWEYKGHTFRSCYDASESHAGLSADEQLGKKLHELQGATEPSVSLTLLVAINDGRLEDYFSRKREVFPWVAKQLEKRNDQKVMSSSVWVIDLKKRAFVTMPERRELSVFRQVLKRLVNPEKWSICEECAAQTVCPIRNNAIALREAKIAKRLEFLFLLSHLRQQRHTTMRDLRSALAYLVTSNKSCEQIHAAHENIDAGTSLLAHTYWQSAFAPIEKSDELLTDLMPLDPGRFPHPHLDRFLHFHQAINDAEIRSYLFTDKTDLAPQRFQDEYEWMAAFKRRLYFEGEKAGQEAQNNTSPSLPRIYWKTLLPYQYAQDFVTLLDDGFADEGVAVFLEEIALGILRSDGIIEDVPEEKLSVKVSASEEQQLVVLKQLPIEDFELRIEASQDTNMVEQLPAHLVLIHKHSGTPRLEITLDLFELLMKMADGLQPTAPEFRPLLEDLKLFKDTLLLRETRDLILIENQYKVHRVAQENGKIVRTRLK